MTIFGSLLGIMGVLFLLLAIGFISRKVGLLNDAASKHLSKLIICLGQPALIISALMRAEWSEEKLWIALWSTLIGFAMHTLFGFSAFLICRKMKNGDHAKIFEFGLVFANCGFLGFPVLDSIFGAGMGSFMGAFYIISFHLFLWTWGIAILGRGRGDIRLTSKKALLNYGTIPCLIGIVLYLLKPVFSLPVFVETTLGYLGGLCTPISLLIIGGLLATLPLKKMFGTPGVYLHSLISLIVFPVVVCLLAKLLHLPDNYILFCTVMAGLPAASTVTMLGEIYGIDPAYASQTVGMTSLFTVGTLPLVCLFANWIISV